MSAQCLAAKLVDAEIAKNRIHPSCEPRFVLELRRILYDPYESLLNDLLRDSGRAELSEGEVEKGGLVPPHEARECCSVPPLKADHKDLVGHVVRRETHGAAPLDPTLFVTRDASFPWASRRTPVPEVLGRPGRSCARRVVL